MNALARWFIELGALLRGTGAALSVSQCLVDIERVRRDLDRALQARDRAIAVAGMAAAPDDERRPPSWCVRPDTGGAAVIAIRQPKAAK